VTPERAKFEADCLEQLKALQSKSGAPELPAKVETLRERIRAVLQQAVRAELLRTAPYQVARLLSPVVSSTWRGGGRAFEFSCGPTQDELKLPASQDCLVRDDDAVVTFSVTVGEKPDGSALELIAYRFDITLPVGSGVPFVRFDLDPPGEGHSTDGLRAHIHPGLPEGRLPSPVLDPVGAVRFLLLHLRAT
jgi:hypothetical protein